MEETERPAQLYGRGLDQVRHLEGELSNLLSYQQTVQRVPVLWVITCVDVVLGNVAVC